MTPSIAQQLALDLFSDNHRWPRKPYCSNDLRQGLRIRTLKHAIKHKYIQANPPHLRVWSIHDCDYPGAALAWEDAGLPPPSWAAINPENAHAHLVWGLSAPVLVDSLHAREAPIRYLCAIEACMRELLRADHGFSGLITKNPAHPEWKLLRGPRIGYDLNELRDWLPDDLLQKHNPRRKKIEEVGLGRNVTLFDRTRHWAYRAIRKYWGGGLTGWNAWIVAVNTQALVYNGDFAAPLDGKEVWWIAKSVAKWTWRNFTPQSFIDLVRRTHTSELQRERRTKSGTKEITPENFEKLVQKMHTSELQREKLETKEMERWLVQSTK